MSGTIDEAHWTMLKADLWNLLTSTAGGRAKGRTKADLMAELGMPPSLERSFRKALEELTLETGKVGSTFARGAFLIIDEKDQAEAQGADLAKLRALRARVDARDKAWKEAQDKAAEAARVDAAGQGLLFGGPCYDRAVAREGNQRAQETGQ